MTRNAHAQRFMRMIEPSTDEEGHSSARRSLRGPQSKAIRKGYKSSLFQASPRPARQPLSFEILRTASRNRCVASDASSSGSSDGSASASETDATKIRQRRNVYDESDSASTVSSGTSSSSDSSSEEEHDLPRRSSRPRRESRRFVDLSAAAQSRIADPRTSQRIRAAGKRFPTTEALRHSISSDDDSVADDSDGIIRDTERDYRKRYGIGKHPALNGAAGAQGNRPVPAGGAAGGQGGGGTTIDATPHSGDTGCTLDDVIGYGPVKARLEELLYPILNKSANGLGGAGPRMPKGLLLYGPPGNGKTHMIRALVGSMNAASTSPTDAKVSFFIRRGADCLSKWVGEAERQLRGLFDTAKKHAPAVIYFDELDGLAPVRSSRQDQIHSSIVNTLLALMDGVDARGDVIVVGSTNRPDCIDPALRRPGRLDTDVYMGPPTEVDRAGIIRHVTRGWAASRPTPALAAHLACLTEGASCSDLSALPAEAWFVARRRAGLTLRGNDKKLPGVPADCWMAALAKMRPRAARSVIPAPMKPIAIPLADTLTQAVKHTLPEAAAGRSPPYYHPVIHINTHPGSARAPDVACAAVRRSVALLGLQLTEVDAARLPADAANLPFDERLCQFIDNVANSGGVLLLGPALAAAGDDWVSVALAAVARCPVGSLTIVVGPCPKASGVIIGPVLSVPETVDVGVGVGMIVESALASVARPPDVDIDEVDPTPTPAPPDPTPAGPTPDDLRTIETLQWALTDIIQQMRKEKRDYPIEPYLTHPDVATEPFDPTPPFPTLWWIITRNDRGDYCHPDEMFDDLARMAVAVKEGAFGGTAKESGHGKGAELIRYVLFRNIVRLARKRANDISLPVMLACNILRDKRKAARVAAEKTANTDSAAVEETQPIFTTDEPIPNAPFTVDLGPLVAGLTQSLSLETPQSLDEGLAKLEAVHGAVTRAAIGRAGQELVDAVMEAARGD